MQTLYVDVYFFINFTVDLLALYFASRFSKIPIGIYRLIAASFIGAIYAVLGIILINNELYMYPISLIVIIAVVFIVCKGVSIYRKFKYTFAFLLFQLIIGGVVYFGYCALDRVFKSEDYISSGGENKKLLILSIIVLLSIGVLRMIIVMFGNTRSEKSVRLEIEYNKSKSVIDAFVDSGNLAVNPMDKTPVMLITENIGEKIFGKDLYEIENPFESKYNIRKRVSVIPVSFGENKRILYGIKPDSVKLICKNKIEKISLVIAIDKEGNGYGGYGALIPLSALDDVL